MNTIEENLEKALDGDFRNSILKSYLFRSNLKYILGKKAKSIHRNLFKQKRVELVLSKDDIEKVLQIGEGGYLKPVVVFDIENGKTDIIPSSSFQDSDENNNLPLLYIEYLFKEFNDINYKVKLPKVSVVLPTFLRAYLIAAQNINLMMLIDFWISWFWIGSKKIKTISKKIAKIPFGRILRILRFLKRF